MVWFPSMLRWLLSDTRSYQACERKPECDAEEIVNGTGAHGCKVPWWRRGLRPGGLVLNDEIVVLVALQFCSDTGQLDLGAIRHSCANQGRHGASERADVHHACRMPLLELANFTLFGLVHGLVSFGVSDQGLIR